MPIGKYTGQQILGMPPWKAYKLIELAVIVWKRTPETIVPKPPSFFSRLFVRIFKTRSKPQAPVQARRLPLSIQPNASYFVEVPTSPVHRLAELIELSDGGVFAVTGVRGAGKSVLLNAISRHFQDRFHTLSLAAPIGSSHEMDFFMALFRLLCDSVKTRLSKTILKEALDLKSIGKRQARRQLVIFFVIGAAIQLPLFFLYTLQQNAFARRVASVSLQRARYELRRTQQDIANEISGVQSYIQTESTRRKPMAVGRSAAPNPEGPTQLEGPNAFLKSMQAKADELKTQAKSLEDAQKKLQPELYSYNQGDLSEVRSTLANAATAIDTARRATRHSSPTMQSQYHDLDGSRFDTSASALSSNLLWPLGLAALELACLQAAWWGFRFLVRFNRFRRNPAALGLLIASSDLIEYLDYELTRSNESEISIPILKEMSGKMKRSSQMKTRSLSLPGLTSQYITYVQQLLDVLPDKLIICIDELDKITDLDGVRSILREIKGGRYVKGCFYVISLSEDVLQAFGGRLSSTRDIFESTFDEIFSISRLDVESCKKVLERRLEASRPDSCAFGAATEDVMILCAVLSSGIPRDLVRNLRECVLAVANNADPSVHLCWEHLFLRKLVELKNEILTFQEYDDVRAALLEELDLLLSFQIGTPEDLGGILVRLEGTVGQLLSRQIGRASCR